MRTILAMALIVAMVKSETVRFLAPEPTLPHMACLVFCYTNEEWFTELTNQDEEGN